MAGEPFQTGLFSADGRTYIPVVPVPASTEAPEKAKRDKKHSAQYQSRKHDTPHAPIIVDSDGEAVDFQQAPPQLVSPVSYQLPAGVVPVAHPAYVASQHTYGYAAYAQGYQIQPYATALPQGTQIYYPTAPPPAADTAKSKKEKKKSGKAKSKKSKKERHHVWQGRTAAEVAYDDAIHAAKEGVYGTNAIMPENPKPGDMFWIHEPGFAGAPKLRTYFEIMDVHKPGRWFRAQDGLLHWQKEAPKDKDGADSSSDEDSDSGSDWAGLA